MTAPIARARFPKPDHGGRPMTLGEIAAAEAPDNYWLSQSDLDDIEAQARFDGVLIGAALGIAVGTPVAFVLFRWLA